MSKKLEAVIAIAVFGLAGFTLLRLAAGILSGAIQ